MNSVNLMEKFSLFNEYWTPKIVGELNGQQVKLAKLQGEFVWHTHENEDEMFFVVKGNLIIEIKNKPRIIDENQEIKTIIINENEFFIVPRGIEHKPIANDEVWIMLFEPATTFHTGDVVSEITKYELEKI